MSPPAIDPSPRCVPAIDGGFVNMLATVFLARRAFHDDPPTVILATGPRFHNFVAAYYIARMFGAKWVLEYRDEWSECSSTCEGWRRGPALGGLPLGKGRCRHLHNAVATGPPSCRVSRLGGLEMPGHPERLGIRRFQQRRRRAAEPAGLDPRRLVIAHVGSPFPPRAPGPFLSTLEQVLARSERLRRELRIKFVGQKSREVSEQLSQFAHPEILESIDHVRNQRPSG